VDTEGILRIAVVGAGYVGLVSAACFAELGHEVVAIESDLDKLNQLRSGQVPIHENLLPELIVRHSGKGLSFTNDIAAGIAGSQAVFITVGTPPAHNGDADLSFVEAVAREIAASLSSRIVVVEKSTVPVRTCEAVARTMSLSGADPELFSIASNPEFLREGTAVSDFLYPDRIVVGADDEHSQAILAEVYAPLTNGSYYRREGAIPGPNIGSARVIFTSVKSAELIKHASNAFLAMKISFINTVANVSEAVGADIKQVCEGIGSDSRIGSKFLSPGIGYGGSCFPKDVLAFRAIATQMGCDAELLSATMNVNRRQRDRFIEKVRAAVWNIRGKRFAVLGLAFKGGTDDIRESPAIEIIRGLVQEGAQITAYDPAAMTRAKAELPELSLTYAGDPYEACKSADALLILTEWQSFSELDLGRVAKLLRLPILLDGRNLFDPTTVRSAGLHYHSIGRKGHEKALVAPKPAHLEKAVLEKTVELSEEMGCRV
jgi:UDPglucose 6-dehydrogenase